MKISPGIDSSPNALNDMQTIAVLMTVHNRAKATIACLKNLHAQLPIKGYETDIFMTDDGCTDGTAKAVAKDFQEVRVIPGSGNLYWNKGMLTAWKFARAAKDYDFYLWLNDDTILNSEALNTLLACSQTYQNKNIIVGTTSATNNETIITYGGRKKKNNLLLPDNSPQECDFFNGNIVLIPRHVFNLTGMNDSRFKHALGDFDYGLRAKKRGIKLIVAPGILGKCNLHESLPVWCNPEKSFRQRWKVFRTPLGHNPEEFFIYENRHHGLLSACFHYFTNHLRVIFPKLWNGRM